MQTQVIIILTKANNITYLFIQVTKIGNIYFLKGYDNNLIVVGMLVYYDF